MKGEPEGECEQRMTDCELRITDDGRWINIYFICVLFAFLLHHFNTVRTEEFQT